MVEIDHNCTDEVVCPYCGYTHEDSHEFFDASGNEVIVECETRSAGVGKSVNYPLEA